MEKISIAIIGGGAAGLFLANALSQAEQLKGAKVTLFERGERLGRKLSATGNGQGNLTNRSVTTAEYFSSEPTLLSRVSRIIAEYDDKRMESCLLKMGLFLATDERGRVYPSGRQASAVTDALRFSLANTQTEILLKTQVTELRKEGKRFALTAVCEGEKRVYCADFVVLCAGGKAAKNFGTDGTAYALAEGFGHTVTPLYPSLVQLKTDVTHTKTLKGIRVNDGLLTASYGQKTLSVQGDIIFTDYGISGDAVFRASAFFSDKIEREKVEISIDFLPNFSENEVYALLAQKQKRYPDLPSGELLFGIVNNQIGRAIIKRAGGDIAVAAKLVKAFSLTAKGTLGFDYAQVTKGGVRMSETTEGLESVKASGLYFAGEILDVDGQCGGFNLQWAFASAHEVAKHLVEQVKKIKQGGQV